MWYQLLTMIIINISSRNRSRNSSSRSKSRSKFDKFRYACVIIHTHTQNTHSHLYRNVDMQASNVKKFPFQPFGCDGSQLTNYRNCTHLHTLHMCLCMSIARNVRLSLCVYLFHSLIWFCVLETDAWRRCFRNAPRRFYYQTHMQPSESIGVRCGCCRQCHKRHEIIFGTRPKTIPTHIEQTTAYVSFNCRWYSVRIVASPIASTNIVHYSHLLAFCDCVFVCVYRYSNHYYYYCYYEPDYYC